MSVKAGDSILQPRFPSNPSKPSGFTSVKPTVFVPSGRLNIPKPTKIVPLINEPLPRVPDG
jgi:hypothetical protein